VKLPPSAALTSEAGTLLQRKEAEEVTPEVVVAGAPVVEADEAACAVVVVEPVEVGFEALEQAASTRGPVTTRPSTARRRVRGDNDAMGSAVQLGVGRSP